MTKNGYTYESDGAVWFKSSDFYDDKDHVLIKTDGSFTYLVPDIGCHINKYQRGFTKMIDVLGTDHHGYVPRLKSAITASGYDDTKLEDIIIDTAPKESYENEYDREILTREEGNEDYKLIETEVDGFKDSWHSWLVAYAPYDAPPEERICVATIVEACNKWEWCCEVYKVVRGNSLGVFEPNTRSQKSASLLGIYISVPPHSTTTNPVLSGVINCCSFTSIYLSNGLYSIKTLINESGSIENSKGIIDLISSIVANLMKLYLLFCNFGNQ